MVVGRVKTVTELLVDVGWLIRRWGGQSDCLVPYNMSVKRESCAENVKHKST